MIRTCRLFFPGRNNYNVSLFNQRTSQPKQTSIEFSFYAEQRKEKYMQRKLNEQVNSEFSTSNYNEKLDVEIPLVKKSKDSLNTDLTENKGEKTKKNYGKLNIDYNSFKDNLMTKPIVNELENTISSKTDGAIKKEKTIAENLMKETENAKVKNIDNQNVGKMGILEVNTPLPQAQDFKSVTFPYSPTLGIAYKTKRMNAQEALSSLKFLAKTGNREVKYLRQISQFFVLQNVRLSLHQCSDVLYTLAKLNYADMLLLQMLSKQLLKILNEGEDVIHPIILLSLIQSTCKLKYHNTELMDELCKHLTKADILLKPEQTALCLFAVSNINLQNEFVDKLIITLSKVKNTDFDRTRNFLNYIWASTILRKEKLLSKEHLEIVLTKSFLDQLNMSGDNTGINKIKLANINGVASKMKDYKGPLLKDVALSPVVSKSKLEFLAAAKDCLSYILPKSGFMETFSYAGSGVFTDIECCVDSACNPVLLKNKDEYNKIGMLLMDHSDYLLHSNALTGINEFKVSILKQMGYNVVIVPYNEFPFASRLSEKIQYVQEKFKNVLDSKNKK